jgi:hypothetical protein
LTDTLRGSEEGQAAPFPRSAAGPLLHDRLVGATLHTYSKHDSQIISSLSERVVFEWITALQINIRLHFTVLTGSGVITNNQQDPHLFHRNNIIPDGSRPPRNDYRLCTSGFDLYHPLTEAASDDIQHARLSKNPSDWSFDWRVFTQSSRISSFLDHLSEVHKYILETDADNF